MFLNIVIKDFFFGKSSHICVRMFPCVLCDRPISTNIRETSYFSWPLREWAHPLSVWEWKSSPHVRFREKLWVWFTFCLGIWYACGWIWPPAKYVEIHSVGSWAVTPCCVYREFGGTKCSQLGVVYRIMRMCEVPRVCVEVMWNPQTSGISPEARLPLLVARCIWISTSSQQRIFLILHHELRAKAWFWRGCEVVQVIWFSHRMVGNMPNFWAAGSWVI